MKNIIRKNKIYEEKILKNYNNNNHKNNNHNNIKYRKGRTNFKIPNNNYNKNYYFDPKK